MGFDEAPSGDLGPALYELRKFARSRGLVVASPSRLVGQEVGAAVEGESGEMLVAKTSHKLINRDLLWEGLNLNKKEKALFEDIAGVLLDHSELDIDNCRRPSGEIPPYEDEKGRWFIGKEGTVVKVGEGPGKRYLLHLGNGGVWKGAPPFDLPLFGSLSEPHLQKPVMIHEGPTAMDGAMMRARYARRTGEPKDTLNGWLSMFDHVSWHGARAGILYTDWRALRGRRVVLWPDMDPPGISYMLDIAQHLALMGNLVEMINWEPEIMEQNPGWDLADIQDTPLLASLNRVSVRGRMRMFENPFDFRGFPHPGWLSRSYVDLDKAEIYMESRNYESIPFSSFNLMYGPKSSGKVATILPPFISRTYLPGRKYGPMSDGRVNVARLSDREPCTPRPIAKSAYKKICRNWLSLMIPSPKERKHVIKRAAWAIANPSKVPNHMVVLQGDSGTGKSTFFDLLCAVAGHRDAISVFPDSIFGNFNAQIANKTIICLHELHSNDINMKQNAQRLKDLVGNRMITIRRKFKPEETVENIVHWFAATNETIPFSMEKGNDRFFFARCLQGIGMEDVRDEITGWLAKHRDSLFSQDNLSALYAGAKHLVKTFSAETCDRMVRRAKTQQIWKDLMAESAPAWMQELDMILEALPPVSEGMVAGIFINDVIRAVRKGSRNVRPLAVKRRMLDIGYAPIRRPRRFNHKKGKKTGGGVVQVLRTNGKREMLWASARDREFLAGRRRTLPNIQIVHLFAED